MAKTEIFGEKKNSLFTHLLMRTKTNKISWNFGKFLLNTNGQPIEYYGPQSSLSAIEDKIGDLMENPT